MKFTIQKAVKASKPSAAHHEAMQAAAHHFAAESSARARHKKSPHLSGVPLSLKHIEAANHHASAGNALLSKIPQHVIKQHFYKYKGDARKVRSKL